MPIDHRLLLAALLPLTAALSSCDRAAPAATGAASRSPAAPPAMVERDHDAREIDGACRLLSRSDVAAVLPGAPAGTPNAASAKYGLQVCTWSDGDRRLQVRLGKAGRSAQDELRGAVAGAIDPAKGDAATILRIEPLPGVGDDAGVVVEPMDAARGVRMGVAAAAVVRGGSSVLIAAEGIADGDRADAIAAMKILASRAESRL